MRLMHSTAFFLAMQTVNFRYFPLRPGDKVLDLGCGAGRHTLAAWLEPGVYAVGADLSEQDLHTARDKQSEFPGGEEERKRLLLCQTDALRLPFPDASFHRVICSEVLEHLPDFRSALQEIRRVLKPGGLFCASVPRYGPERLCWALRREYTQTPGGHVRIFRAQELRSYIEALGFHCYRRHWAHALHSPYWWLQCLLWHRREHSWLVQAWHRLLVWDLMQRPLVTRALEALLNPLIGKSTVLYFRREGRTA